MGGRGANLRLDAIVRAHGSLFWKVTYCQPPAAEGYATAMLFTFDEYGLGRGGRDCATAASEAVGRGTP